MGKRNLNESKENYICVIGAVNIDITGFSDEKLKFKDANIGYMKISMGGVGRNIAENLSRLNKKVKLISVFGDDYYSQMLIEHSKKIGVNISDSLFLKNSPSSVFLSIMDSDRDLALGLSAMDVYDKIGISFIRKKISVIRNADITVIDTNLPEKIISYVMKNVKNQKFFVDTVSGQKALRVKNLLGYIHLIKMNVIEAELVTGKKINNKKDLIKAADYLHKKGVKKVLITLGSKGVFISENNSSEILQPFKTKIKNTNGAGDALFSGVVLAQQSGYNFEDSTKIGLACAAITIAHEDTVSPEINFKNIMKLVKPQKNN